MNIDLSGKTAIVTGSTAGIGFAIAKGFAESGASVVINGRTSVKVDAALERLTEAVPGTGIRGIAADLGTADGCKTLVDAVPATDILVNNLGIFGPRDFLKRPTRNGNASTTSTSCPASGFPAPMRRVWWNGNGGESYFCPRNRASTYPPT